MNYPTILISCILHIVLVLIFEGIFLFVILYPILKDLSHNISNDIGNQIYNFVFNNILTFNPSEITIMKSGYAAEKIYLSTQDYMPYIVFAILELSLIFTCIIVILLANYMNVKIDYWFIIINSIIVFGLICGIAFFILWNIIFTQPYTMDLYSKLCSAFLDTYNSA
jgi:hypothetical protein